MLASNLTLGVYIRFIPQLLHNSSAVAVNGTHEGLGNPSMVGLTVIPLVATMVFIIGRLRRVKGQLLDSRSNLWRVLGGGQKTNQLQKALEGRFFGGEIRSSLGLGKVWGQSVPKFIAFPTWIG